MPWYPLFPSYDRKVVFKMNESVFALEHKQGSIREVIMNPWDTESRGVWVEEENVPWNEQESIEKLGADPRLL